MLFLGDKDEELLGLGDTDEVEVGEYLDDCEDCSVLIVLGVIIVDWNVTWLELALSGEESDEDPTNWARLAFDNSFRKFSFSLCNCFIVSCFWISVLTFSVLSWRKWAAVLAKASFNLFI